MTGAGAVAGAGRMAAGSSPSSGPGAAAGWKKGPASKRRLVGDSLGGGEAGLDKYSYRAEVSPNNPDRSSAVVAPAPSRPETNEYASSAAATYDAQGSGSRLAQHYSQQQQQQQQQRQDMRLESISSLNGGLEHKEDDDDPGSPSSPASPNSILKRPGGGGRGGGGGSRERGLTRLSRVKTSGNIGLATQALDAAAEETQVVAGAGGDGSPANMASFLRRARNGEDVGGVGGGGGSSSKPVTRSSTTMFFGSADDEARANGAAGWPHEGRTCCRYCQARCYYKFDQFIAKRRSQVILIVILMALSIFVLGAIFSAVDEDQYDDGTDRTFMDAVWDSWAYMADPGTHAEARTTPQRIVAFIIAWTGIFFFSTILGIIVDAVSRYMDDLKKGKSKVVESGHYLVLGWTDKSLMLLYELALSLESSGGGVIVVLADYDKPTMEIEFRRQLSKKQMCGTSVVFRRGNPQLTRDLERVSALTAMSIVVLAEEGDADKADAGTLRTVLSLVGMGGLDGHIVAEVRDVDNEPLLRLVASSNIETIVSHDIIGRLMIMAVRMKGLTRVFGSVLGFEGDEFYLNSWDAELRGLAFKDVLTRVPDAIAIGIKTSADESGVIELCPDPERIIDEGEQLLVLAEDQDTYKVFAEEQYKVQDKAPPTILTERRAKEKVLMCGWRRDIRDMISLIDSLLLAGSELHMLCLTPIHERERQMRDGGLNPDALKHIELVHHFGSPVVRRQLEAIDIHTFDSIMILGDEGNEMDMMHSDSQAIATLLIARDAQRKGSTMGNRIFRHSAVVTEILDGRTRATVRDNPTLGNMSECAFWVLERDIRLRKKEGGDGGGGLGVGGNARVVQKPRRYYGVAGASYSCVLLAWNFVPANL